MKGERLGCNSVNNCVFKTCQSLDYISYQFHIEKMRVLVSFLLMFLISSVGTAQFAMINSPKGYARALENEYTEGELVLQNGEIIYILLIEGDTIIADCHLGGDMLESAAFLSSDILPFTGLNRVLKVYESPDSVLFDDTDLHMKMKRSSFVPSDHQCIWIQPDSSSDYQYLREIDGHRVVGTDGDYPNFSMDAVSFTSKRFSGTLITDFLYEPNFLFTDIYYDEDRDLYIVTTLGSDGAGSYAAYWIIDKNGEIEPVVTIPF